MDRREFLALGPIIAAQATGLAEAARSDEIDNRCETPAAMTPASASGWRIQGDDATAATVEIASKTYAVNRRQDLLSQGNRTGYRMTVSRGYPIAMGIIPDTTFAMLGSRYLENRQYLDTLAGHADALPRNMRRNGKFFINEDLVAGADRVMTQVMYPIWIWQIFLATGDREFLDRHAEPVRRCLSHIDSRTDERGVVNQVDHDDWQISEGADWVDWCPERMEGSTCVYHSWYVEALRCCVQLFRHLGDQQTVAALTPRLARQQRVISDIFWNGKQFYDNLNYQGEPVANFWCDSQIWPIAFGQCSAERAQTIFARLDAQPEVYLGCGLRWCAPSDAQPQMHRPLTWFGRLGGGLVIARCRHDQVEAAWQTIAKFSRAVLAAGTIPECFDMQGRSQSGTSGGEDYLEHAGGLLYCVGRGVMGLDDTLAGPLRWRPKLPRQIESMEIPFWHKGHCWRFSYDQGKYAIDPDGGAGEVELEIEGRSIQAKVQGKKLVVAN